MSIAAVAGGIIGGLLVMFAIRPVRAASTLHQVLRAESFTVVDRDGRDRAVLGLADGRPILMLTDDATDSEITLHIGNEGMFLRFFRGSEAHRLRIPRIGLGTLEDGTPGIELADANGKLRGLFGIDAERRSFVRLTDRNGEAQIVLTAAADGTPSLQILDQQGNPVKLEVK
jgi:hypothetical protein